MFRETSLFQRTQSFMNDIFEVNCNVRDFDLNSLFYHIFSLDDNAIRYIGEVMDSYLVRNS